MIEKMKNTRQLIKDLRFEYIELCTKIVAALFALKTLPLDEEEKRLLDYQIDYMEEYSKKLLERAEYSVKKERGETEK
jgi:hypothetical protein